MKPTISCRSFISGTSSGPTWPWRILESLHDRYPGNPLFLARSRRRCRTRYQHDITASLDTWRTLLALAREQRVNESEIAEVAGPAGCRPPARRALPDRPRHRAAAPGRRRCKPSRPFGALAAAYLALGEARGSSRPSRRRGRRLPSRRERRARPEMPEHPPARRGSAAAARRMPTRADAYRLSLEGFRKLERSDLAGAEAALTRSIALDPDDPVARYRYGRVLQARRQDAPALAQFELTIDRAQTARRRLPRPRTSKPRVCTSGSAIATRRSATTAPRPRGSAQRSDARAAANRALDATQSRRADRMRSPVAITRVHDTLNVDDRRSDVYSSSNARSETNCRMQFFDFSCTLCLTHDFSHP